MSDKLICLDLSESFIKVADAQTSGNQIEIKNLGFVPSLTHFYSIDTEKTITDQAALISKLFSSLKINKRNVNVIIPDSVSYSQIIEMPRLNEKELVAAIRYQADQFIPMPLEEVTLDIEILNEDKINRKVLVLIVASPRSIINKIEKTTEIADLVCESIENELSATLRLLSMIFSPKPDGKTFIIINLSSSSTGLYLYDQKRSIILQSHNFNIGYELFNRELQQNMSVDDKQTEILLKDIGFTKNASYNLEEILSPVYTSLLKQIEKFIIMSQDKFNLKVEANFLINESVRINELDKKIGNYLSIPTANLDIFEFIKNNQTKVNLRQSLPLFVSTLGGSI